MTEIVLAVAATVGMLALTAASLNAGFGVLARATGWQWMRATAWGWVDRGEAQVVAAIVCATAAGVDYALGSAGAAVCGVVLAGYWAVVAARSTRKVER